VDSCRDERGADPYRPTAMAACTLSPRFATELALELEPGERVVWTGVPKRLALLRRVLAELWLPLLYNGFVVALVAMCGGRLSLAAVPLLTFGLPLFHGPLGAWGAMKTTFYAVTDRRALVFDAEGIWAATRAEIVGVRVRAGDVALSLRRRAPTAMVGLADAGKVAALLR
jgi:hypothetical protein